MMRSLLLLLLLPILSLAGCAIVPPLNLPVSRTQPPDIHPKKPVRVMLVLGSGGARSVAEAGVIKVLTSAGVPIDAIVGTSAGSIVGALYASNPDPEKLAKTMLTLRRNQVVKFNILNLNKGLVSGYTLQRFIIKHVPTGLYFRNLKIPFGVMTTNFTTGKAHFINSGVIASAVNASSAIPGVFKIVNLYGKKFVDGAISAPLGTQKAREFYKPKLLIAITIHVDLDSDMPRTLLNKMDRGVDILGINLELEQYRFADIVIHPAVGTIGSMDTSSNSKLFKEGLVAGKKYLPAVLRAMREKGIARVKAK